MRNLFFTLLLAALTSLGVNALTVNNTAGGLSQRVSDTQITQLKVTGTMDARDFLFITEQLNELTVVDLSQVTIVSYNGGRALYGTITSYAEGEVPRTAFFGKKLTSVTLPAGIQSIGFAAFAGCDRLQSVTLPASLVYLADYAFAGCGLISINLSSSILDMGKGVFSRCESMTSAVINARSVGDFAFLGNTALSNVSLGANVQYIMRGAFNGCNSLKGITIDPATHLYRIDEEAFINSGLENIDIKAMAVGTVGDWAFAQTKLSSMDLSDGMTNLGVGALAHNPLLTTVTLPGVGHDNTDNGRGNGNPGGRRGVAAAPVHTLEAIKDYTFAGDALLNAGDLLKKDVTTIGNYAFYNVSANIDTMRLPETIVYLGDYAMAGMTGMKVLKTDATTVPELGENVWAGVNQPAVPLIAPDDESTELYKAADQWMNFFFQGEDDFLLGDVNEDGAVNIADVTSLIDYLLGSGNNINLRNADVNQDGAINIADVTALIDLLLGGSKSKLLHQIGDQLTAKFPKTNDYLSMSGLTLRPGETATVDVALNNDDNYIAMQCELVLPQGVKLVSVDGIERGSKHSNYNTRHDVETNVYTLINVSTSLDSYAGHEGKMMRLTVAADETFNGGVAELRLANVTLITENHAIVLASDAVADVNNGTGINQITATKEVAAVRYINIAGQESDTPFEGVNIVVTTYTDGTSTTAKVIK
ncbi:MAG: leucine-rich repeat protein [Muribaculaceae bacterium]|nr:leucine-rich repeat protein [Muribaculaceae bacterium]